MKKSSFEPITSASRTIPGQSLKPADLLKRHLAGTLPEIDHSSKYEYHYDENGNKIGEPLPLEMHEVHRLAVALRKRQFEEATEHRRRQALKERDAVIAEYKAQLLAAQPTAGGEPPLKTPPEGA